MGEADPTGGPQGTQVWSWREVRISRGGTSVLCWVGAGSVPARTWRLYFPLPSILDTPAPVTSPVPRAP